MRVDVVSPFPPQSLPRVWYWLSGIRSDDFAPQTLDQFVDAMLDAIEHQMTWAIIGNGELGGMVTFQRLTQWVGTAHIMLKPELQGKGVAAPALRIAFGEMFETGIGKLIFYPLGSDDGIDGRSRGLAVGALLISLGAQREGTLRAQTLVKGKPTAINIYGLLREEFENALGTYSRSRDRRDSLDRGRSAGGPVEDVHVLNDPDLVTGDVGPARPAELVQPGSDGRPISGDGPDQGGGAGENQPPVCSDAGHDLEDHGGSGVRLQWEFRQHDVPDAVRPVGGDVGSRGADGEPGIAAEEPGGVAIGTASGPDPRHDDNR